jgi:hypothetical protein
LHFLEFLTLLKVLPSTQFNMIAALVSVIQSVFVNNCYVIFECV